MTEPEIKYPAAAELLAFIDASPSPYHCVQTVETELKKHGFVELSERNDWPKPLPECFFVKRNDSALCAFMVPEGGLASDGFLLAGAHTDSPCLRVKHNGEFSAHGYQQLGVEVYGGALEHTWTDRDLGLSGRLVVKDGAERKSVLVSCNEPLIRVPNLAIHLQAERKKVSYNAQTELSPIIAMGDEKKLLQVLAETADVNADDILSTELFSHITEPSAFWGADKEFIAAPRLDNQAMCCSMLTGFLEALENDPGKIQGICLFDNEEIGSGTMQGADSNFLEALLQRITHSQDLKQADTLKALANSFFISADMAHAIHPNYAQRSDSQNHPLINKGPVIKSNANFRYATDGPAAVAFQDICDAANAPSQNFINRSDLGCGSTIGPMTSARVGMRCLDVGNPQFAMHSCRESAGALDPGYMNAVFAQYFGFGIALI